MMSVGQAAQVEITVTRADGGVCWTHGGGGGGGTEVMEVIHSWEFFVRL